MVIVKPDCFNLLVPSFLLSRPLSDCPKSTFSKKTLINTDNVIKMITGQQLQGLNRFLDANLNNFCYFFLSSTKENQC